MKITEEQIRHNQEVIWQKYIMKKIEAVLERCNKKQRGLKC